MVIELLVRFLRWNMRLWYLILRLLDRVTSQEERNERSSCSNSAVVSVSSVLKACSTVLFSGRTELVLDTSYLSYPSFVRTSAPPPGRNNKLFLTPPKMIVLPMTILVTGGGGFIGSHLVDYLLSETAETIYVLDDFSTGNPSNLAHLETDRITIKHGDIRESETVTKAATDADKIYHLAAAVGVEKVVDEPLDSLQTNLKGTENVLEAALTEDADVFIASSSEVYGKSNSLPFSEDDDRILGPINVPRWGYASAKAVDEFLGLAYHEQYELPVTIGRYFNIVGPRQVGEYGMVIPTFVEQALAGKPLTVYGDGTQQRSFTHVADAVKASHELLEATQAQGEIFNIGTANPTTINELAKRVIEQADSTSAITHVPFKEVYGENFEEPDRREPDITKLRETLGWAPKLDLDRILVDVIAERRSNQQREAG